MNKVKSRNLIITAFFITFTYMITIKKQFTQNGITYKVGDNVSLLRHDEKILVSNGFAEPFKKLNKKRKIKIETK